MEVKKCRNKNCERLLPKGYKYKYCENCRNKRVKFIKDSGKKIAGFLFLVGGTALTIGKKGKK